ncbi:MAG: molybdopterin-dependent oxidoreductase [Acidobacteria bacterium]|nr:molybdopterin-dependent oxidoreductase [Acidobacteriota bacterium]
MEPVMSKAITRRTFMNGAATAAAAAALAPQLGCARFLRSKPAAAVETREVATACEVCPNKCAVMAVVEGGRIRKLNPNPASPKSRGMLCARGNAAVKAVYDPDRVKQPLIRAGARGEGKWRTATWDEAWDFAAKHLTEIKEKHGPEAVIWSSTEGFQEEFFKNLGLAYGSPNILRHPTLCLASVNLAYSMTFGTVPSFDLLNADYVIMSGANRFESIITPDTMDLIDSTMNRKARLVYLDPRFTVTASKADEWYPIRPGTDMAFILAMLNVIIGEERYDKEFVASACHGFEELRAHVQRFTPEWAAGETEIPAANIRRIAHEFADAAPRALYYAGRRSSWYSNDFQMRRAQAILNAIVGNWDREGGVVPNSKIALGEYLYLPWDEPTAARIDEMEERFPLAAKGDGVFLQARENVLAGKPYPVKGWMVYKQDPMSALPDRGRTQKMLEQMDFVAVIDTQMSDTAWFADVVFPESTYLERTDPLHMLPGIWPVVAIRQQVVPPIHDTKPNLEIVQGLAKRLELSDYFDYTIEQWLEEQAKELPIPNALEHLKRTGVYTAPGAPFYGSTRKPDHRFLTRSGKIELFSERLAEAGHDPLPAYTPPVQPPPGAFRLILGRKATHTHANSTNNVWLAEFAPSNDLWLNPLAADRLGVASGDLVEVRSDVGVVRLKARVTEEIRPDCVFMLHGFGKKSRTMRLAYDNGACDADVLVTAMDAVSGNAAFHETFVRVAKVGEAAGA